MPEPNQQAPDPSPLRTSRQIIRDAIADLYSQQQCVTRETLAEVTGLSMSRVDDHVGNFVNDGELRRIRAGVFVPIPPAPDPRPVSVTDMPDGMTIIEVGDFVAKIWPKERRALATRLVGDAVQYSNIQAAHDAGENDAELLRRLKQLDQDVRRLSVALSATAQPPTELSP